MLQILQNLRHTTQLRLNGAHNFKAKHFVFFEAGSYVVKTAENQSELLECFKLRDEVFNQEFKGLPNSSLDFDRFDFHFDHLIILNKQINKVIGTYRLRCFEDLILEHQHSYTALEFNLHNINDFDGPYLELGRACIKREYRKGSVISLLWRGIAEYMQLSGANIMFGCSSVKIANAREAALLFSFLKEQNQVALNMRCSVQSKFLMDGLIEWLEYFSVGLKDYQIEEAQKLMPSLLKSYLNMGAKVGGLPAFDRDFQCIDLITVLRKSNLSKALADRFQLS